MAKGGTGNFKGRPVAVPRHLTISANYQATDTAVWISIWCWLYLQVVCLGVWLGTKAPLTLVVKCSCGHWASVVSYPSPATFIFIGPPLLALQFSFACVGRPQRSGKTPPHVPFSLTRNTPAALLLSVICPFSRSHFSSSTQNPNSTSLSVCLFC